MSRHFIILIFYFTLFITSLAQSEDALIIQTGHYTPPILIDHTFNYSLYVNLEYNVYFDITFPIFDPHTSFSGAVWSVKRVEDSTLWEFDDFWRDGYVNWDVDTTTGLIHYWVESNWPLRDDILLGGQPGTYVLRFGKVVGLPVPLSHYQYWHNMDSIGIYFADTVRWDAGLPHIKDISIVQPCARNWLPVIEGYIDETGHPNYDDFKVTLSAKFATQTPPRSYKFRWVLQNISWYDGACMNYRAQGPDSTSLLDSLESSENSGGPTNPDKWWLADLMILGRYNPGYSCWYDTNRCAFYGETNHPVNNDAEFSIVVSSYDFGAHGDILLEAQADSASPWYNMTKYQRSDSLWATYSTIPIDEDNPLFNKCMMADYWKTLMLADTLCPDTITIISQVTPTQNIDQWPLGYLQLQLGDEVNTFEEYRGFYCRGVHKRTVPWTKDFFIYSDLDTSSLNTGIGYASLLPYGVCHWIDSTEMHNYSRPAPRDSLRAEARAVNWLSERIDSIAICPCAILLNNRSTVVYDSLDTLGLAYFYRVDSSRYYCVPQNTILGYLFTNRVRYHTPPHRSIAIFDSLDIPWQNSIAGHEIGHMVNMPDDTSNANSIMYYGMDSYHPQEQYMPEDLGYYWVKPYFWRGSERHRYRKYVEENRKW
ncbi:MAG: hypothetical protein NTW14_08340 [bacterium]|nr:hypothetical protein [bacterium]